MRTNKTQFDRIQTGRLIGSNKACGRVTVEPAWQLKETVPTYGSTIRGPYRYYVDGADNRTEVEVPNIQSIQIDRSLSQDIATCKIVLYNQYHNGNSIVPELGTQLGKPGYFWPRRGESSESYLLWNQTAATGAYMRNGTYDSNFEWTNVLIPNGLIRTYQGWGGSSKSVDQAVTDDDILLTGVWLIDRISGGTDGTLLIECRDVGRLLLEQIIYPPLVPNGLYPLSYYPPGQSAFDSTFGAKPVTGVGLAKIAEVRLWYTDSSFGNGSIAGHYASEAADDNVTNFSWTPAWATPSSGTEYHWWGFSPTGAQVMDAVHFRPWGGGYTAYISVKNGGTWLGTETVPCVGGTIPYLKKMQVPYAIPDGFERELVVQLDAAVTGTYVRITLGPSYQYSSVADGSNYYRAGLRTVNAQRTGGPVDAYDAPFDQAMWTFGMAGHPVRGYWVVDDDGWVYGFGDAADYDSSTYGQVPLGYSAGIGGANNYHIIGLAAHPSGRGYWALDNAGSVWAYGEATDYGEYVCGLHPYNDGVMAMDITPTYTGNGYWVAYSDGTIRGFGDATPSYTMLPDTVLTNYMMNHGPQHLYLYPAANPIGFAIGYRAPSAYGYMRKCTGIVGHPTKMGFWATDGCGQVFPIGDVGFYGELQYRTYNAGASNTFSLNPTEWPTSIETTQSGNGYWLLFPSGHIAAFGDAINQGTSFIYEGNSQIDIQIPTANQDWSFFRAIAWGLVHDPDGSGFWVLTANGSVRAYNAMAWGQPGWAHRYGFRWHDGNINDYKDIVVDLLAWSGFTYYATGGPPPTPTEPGIKARPPVLGNIESTGIPTTTTLEGDKWDKRTIIDCINELKSVTAYNFYIDEEGLPHFESPNIWRAGNFSLSGERLFAKYEEDGTWSFVEESDPDAEPFIPEVHEAVDMMSYQASLDGEALRSEIIIGSNMPDLNDPTRTGFVRFTPPAATEEVMSGVPTLRGINRPSAWVNTNFTNPTENLLMAELISLRMWFAQRTGNANIVANPNLGVGDQIRLIERNTSETYIHVINAISSNMSLDQGTWTMQVNTNWLGDANDWVITSSNTYNPITHVGVSERVDRWQLALDKGLQFHGDGTGAATLGGGFE